VAAISVNIGKIQNNDIVSPISIFPQFCDFSTTCKKIPKFRKN
jgi:hypothetical protein